MIATDLFEVLIGPGALEHGCSPFARAVEAAHQRRAAGLGNVDGALPVATVPESRIQHLLLRIHLLGERPFAVLFIQVETGGDLHGMLEAYASFAMLADLIRELGCDRLAKPRPINRGRR